MVGLILGLIEQAANLVVAFRGHPKEQQIVTIAETLISSVVANLAGIDKTDGTPLTAADVHAHFQLAMDAADQFAADAQHSKDARLVPPVD